MPATLEGKVALVTGVSRDGQVGQTVAKVLAENGAALAICARTQNNVEERAEELRQAGARVLAVAASLTDEAQVREWDRFCLKGLGLGDILAAEVMARQGDNADTIAPTRSCAAGSFIAVLGGATASWPAARAEVARSAYRSVGAFRE